MPCRALEAFGPVVLATVNSPEESCLNALSGIGGVWTWHHQRPEQGDSSLRS